jgi:SAM-dependent methyltransferase
MPLDLGPDEARAYLRTHEAPAPHLDLVTAAGFRGLGAALRLGLIDALAPGPLDAPALAAATGCDPRGVGLLADVLVSFGHLTRDGEAYALAPAARWLLPDSPIPYGPVVSLWQHLLFRLWDDLESSVRQGKPALDFYGWLDGHPDVRDEFQQVQAGLAGWLAGELVELVAVPPGASSLLDVGGGHAVHTAAFCRRHPGLRGTVVDLPGSLAAGRGTVAAAGLADRVELRPGNWADADLGTGHDVALLFNVLHGNDPGRNAALLRRVAAALRPGGVVAVLENIAEEGGADAVADTAFVRVFSLNLFHSQGGRIYGRDDIAGWLAGAGFAAPEWSTLRQMPADHLAVAVLP